MTTHEKIDFAILETIRVHPDFIPTLSMMLYSNMTSKNGINPDYFTSSNNARSYIREIKQDDLLEFMLEEVVKCYNALSYYIYNNTELNAIKDDKERIKASCEIFPGLPKLQKAILKIADNNINVKTYYQLNTKELLDLVTAVVQTRYQVHSSWRTYIDKVGNGKSFIKNSQVDLLDKIRKDMSSSSVAKNVEFNQKALNRCFSDVMSGAQLKNQHNNYGLDGNLFAAQDIGKNRSNQEDSVLILTHPENNNFKLIVVSDGMGGVDYGEKASQYITQQLGIWFSKLPVSLYKEPNKVQELLKAEIAKISGEIYDRWNTPETINSGCTLATSIVTEKATITATVGDSRIYCVKDGELTLMSRDESAVWPSNKTQFTISNKELDDLRFHIYNNQITRCIGYRMNASSIQSLIIDNSLYDKIILLSDGVTDLLTQEEIKIISTVFPPHMVAEQLVQSAITNSAKRPAGADNLHNGIVSAGKDNATAAMFSRR